MTALRRWRWPVAAVLVVLLGAVLTVVLAGGRSSTGTLDPDSAAPDGGRALASLMQERGFTVVSAHTTAEALAAVRAAGNGSTLFVTDPPLLSGRQLDDLAAQPVGRLILVQPDDVVAEALAPDSRAFSAFDTSATLAPTCADADASASGKADIGDGAAFSGTDGCYPVEDGSALVTTQGPASQDTVLVGNNTLFRNDKLDENGNAALAMRLLGKHSTIVWYLPDSADPEAVADSPRKSLWDVIPPGWHWGTGMMFVALVLLALWQSRRLGPVSVEKLPVVVRAAEAVEGRARLYERGQVRGGAADALRAAALSRLAVRLGLARGATPADVAAAVAVRGGRAAVETAALLEPGTAPADDRQLVALAATLDALEAEVGRL